jgi:hypothetical protein
MPTARATDFKFLSYQVLQKLLIYYIFTIIVSRGFETFIAPLENSIESKSEKISCNIIDLTELM